MRVRIVVKVEKPLRDKVEVTLTIDAHEEAFDVRPIGPLIADVIAHAKR